MEWTQGSTALRNSIKMDDRTIRIESAGLFTTVQDTGRYGYQSYGLPVSGAMDSFSLYLANKLVGNPQDYACLEATFTGPEISFNSPAIIAVTGADMGPCINGREIPGYCPVEVKAGDVLSFSGLKSGCRTYVAFSGGIDVPLVMGSRSTYLRGRLGGYQGRALQAGDIISLGLPGNKSSGWEMPPGLLPEYRPEQVLRVIAGPDRNCFEREGMEVFFESGYVVTGESDRMGYRLYGPEVRHKPGHAEIISSGVSMGTVQVPGNGQPIVLLADRQTTGGYPRIASIISVDLTLIAQMIPGDKVYFREVTTGKARKLQIERHRLLSDLKP